MNKRDGNEPKTTWIDLLKLMWYFLKGDRKKYVLFVLLLLVIYTYPILPPILLGLIINFFNTYQAGDSLTYFYTIVAVYGISHIIVSQLRLLSKFALSKISAEVYYNIRTEGFDRLMDFSIQWHDKENSGNKVQRIISGSDAIKTMMKQFYRSGGIFVSVVGVVSVLTAFLFLDIEFFFFMLVYMIGFIYIEYRFYSKIYEMNIKRNIANEQSSGTYYEGTSNVLTVKTLGIKDSVKNKINTKEREVVDHTVGVVYLGNSKWRWIQLLNGVSYILFLLLIGKNVIAASLSIGFILVYFKYFSDFQSSTTDLTNLIVEYSELKSKAIRLLPVFRREISNKIQDKKFPSDWS